MSVTITSFVPAFAGGSVTTGSLILNAPNQGVTGQLAMLFMNPGELLIGTGTNQFSVETLGDILDGTHAPGYSYNDLALPTAFLDINNQLISNVLDPVGLQDAATKNYVDTAVGLIGGPFLPLTGGTMTGNLLMDATADLFIDDGSASGPSLAFRLDTQNGLFRPASNTVAFATAGQERLRINSNGSIGVGVSYNILVTSDEILTNKKYVDDSITTALGGLGPFLPLVGGTMTGAIVLAADPTAALEPATMQYTDAADDLRLLLDGSDTMTGALDMGTNLISDVVDPVGAQDAATKNYIDTEIVALGLGGATGPFLRLSGVDTMVGALDMGTFGVINMTSPTLATDGATKGYVDTQITALGLVGVGPYLPLAGGTMTGTLALNADPTFALEASTKSYVDTEIVALSLNGTGPYLRLSGADTMVGALDMGTNPITAVVDPTGAQDAATKNYVDTEIVALNLGGIGPFLKLDGSTMMTGALPMGNNLISGVVDPVGLQDAATKNYVDTEIVSLGLTASGPFLRLSGADTMLGNLDMGGFDITNSGTFNPGDHIFGASDYTSNLAGNSFLIRLTATPGVSAPTYSFASDPDTGIYGPGSDAIEMVTNGAQQLSVTTTEINAHNKPVKNVVDPVAPQDAATKNYIDGLNSVRLLGKTIGVDLTVAVSSSIYTVPVGKKHVVTDVIVRLTSLVPGGSPVSPIFNVGTAALFNQIVDGFTMTITAANAADQAWYTNRDAAFKQGAVTPNAGSDVRINVTTAAAGTISAAVADVYVLGYEA